MKIPFVKMHGLGNDFVLLDERDRSFDLDRESLSLLADRRLGVGCDQVLSIEAAGAPRAVARYRVFNADGTMAEHCGNGVRCVALYMERRGEVASDGIDIEIDKTVVHLNFEPDGQIRADMGQPQFSPSEIPMSAIDLQTRYQLEIEGETIEFGAVSLGNPHAVIQVEAVTDARVTPIGERFQHCSRFPRRVNVGFMQIVDRQLMKLRVYERGVGETRACGTGACAAVAIGRRWDLLDDEVTVELTGGSLKIDWDGDPRHSMWMTGPATFVYEGTIEL